MSTNVTAEWVVQALSAQGVATDPKRAEPYAVFVTTVLGNSAAAYAQLAFEQEPAAYVAELARNAP